MPATIASPWRRRLSELGRGVGKPHPPLFAPLLYGVASQVEALAPAEVTADATRLAKNLAELRRALGTAHLVTAAPTAMEAEALGATVDRDAWPPKVVRAADPSVLTLAEFDGVWLRSEALAASLEATRRLAATEPGETPIVAALTGPARLLDELCDDDARAEAAAFELAGRALAALARAFAEAGVSAVVLGERRAAVDAAGWAGALGTIANVARFHRIPVLLTFAVEPPSVWPVSVVACPPEVDAATAARPHGISVAADPERWASDLGAVGAQTRVVVTAEEVSAHTSIETLQSACEDALDIERGPVGS